MSINSCSKMAFQTCAFASASSSIQSARLPGASLAARRTALLTTPQRASSRAGRCQVASQDNESSPSNTSGSPTLNTEEISKQFASVFSRYDFVSAGIGALAVTGICVSHGQDPGTALSITAASTVVALVINDIFFEN
jgi:hypothetical protein